VQSERTLHRIALDSLHWAQKRREVYDQATKFRQELEEECRGDEHPLSPKPVGAYVSPNLPAMPARGMSAALADAPFSLDEAVLAAGGRKRKRCSYADFLEAREYVPWEMPSEFQGQPVRQSVDFEVKGLPRPQYKRFLMDPVAAAGGGAGSTLPST